MNILLLGGGGREHALAWSLAKSPRVTHLRVAPGNGGLAELAECVPVDLEDPAAVVALATGRGAVAQTPADLVVVGPEAPLAAGSSRSTGTHSASSARPPL
ncbi:MAG: phosphoribosylamine--glycine ligase N-terminal domain-containing protein, partial [Pseudomonadota bacterium]